jgi:hypothetical protein
MATVYGSGGEADVDRSRLMIRCPTAKETTVYISLSYTDH